MAFPDVRDCFMLSSPPTIFTGIRNLQEKTQQPKRNDDSSFSLHMVSPLVQLQCAAIFILDSTCQLRCSQQHSYSSYICKHFITTVYYRLLQTIALVLSRNVNILKHTTSLLENTQLINGTTTHRHRQKRTLCLVPLQPHRFSRNSIWLPPHSLPAYCIPQIEQMALLWMTF